MATIVQSKAYNGGSLTTHTIVLDTAATNGNDIIIVCTANASTFSGGSTFNASAMTTDYEEFTAFRIARFRVTAGGTNCVTVLAAADNLYAVVLEVSGLTSTPFEASVNESASGEGAATSHTLEFAAGNANRCVFQMVLPDVSVTVTGVGGSVIYPTGFGFRHVLFKDAIGSAAGAASLTTSVSASVNYFSATYLNAAAAGGNSLAWIRA